MPSRNVIRDFVEGGFYHVYNRGVEKRIIFLDDDDYTVFLGLLKRYLGNKRYDKRTRHRFPKLSDKVEVLAYCLMPNHFHLLIHQADTTGVEQLMRRLSTSYSMYFNKKYHRVGGLFQGPYRASLINADAYLTHISRYIHLNPKEYDKWTYSSYIYYAGRKKTPTWLNTGIVMEQFDGADDYKNFLAEYVDTKKDLDAIKWQLADDALG